MAKKKQSQQAKLNVNESRRRKTKAFIIFDIIFFAITVYLGLCVGTIDKSTSNALFNFIEWNKLVFGGKPAYLLPYFGPGMNTQNLLITLAIFLLIFIALSALLWYDDLRHRHDLEGIEKGSAQWNDDYKAFDRDYGETDKFGTTFLSKNVALSMNTRKTLRNNNVLIIGGSGAGKTRFFVKPNVLQTNCNMVITDPSGELIESTGTYLKQEGYAVKVFNLVEMHKSNCYNPFHYIRDDQGVIMMINCLIKNTTPPESHSSDPFWEKSETALLQALCFYLKDHRPLEEQNFATVMELLRWAEVDEKNPDFESKLDRIFLKSKQKSKRPAAASLHGMPVGQTEDDADFNKYLAKSHYVGSDGQTYENVGFKSLEELDEQGTDIAVKQYKIFKMGAGKTAKSILISCAVRLTVFNLPQLARLTGTDDIHLEDLGGTNPDAKKQALFVIIPAADSTFNFLVSMMYSQLFETLYFVAETNPACSKKRLPQHVKFLLDEFANIGTIPEFTKKLATMRKYEISCSVILQNLAQIKTMYKDDWESIVGNCDSMVFLGGKEYTTLEYLSKELGMQTITGRSRTMQASSQKTSGHDSHGYQTEKRELLTPDELGNLDNSMCVVQIRGLNPFLDNKYDYLQHPRYKFTSDADSSLSYQNPLNNMIARPVNIVEDAIDIMDTEAKTVNKMYSLEDMIRNNPNWSDYPSIFKDFKAVPATPDDSDEIDEVFDAIAQNPELTYTEAAETEQNEAEDVDLGTTPTVLDVLNQVKNEGVRASDVIAEELPSKNFFGDEDDEEG